MKPNGAGHEQVIVLADDGPISAVGLPFVGDILIEAALVALDVQPLTYHLYKCGDDDGLRGHVGVETVLAWATLLNILFRLPTCIQIRVNVLYLIEDIAGLVAIDLTLTVVRLECVALDDEQ